MLFGSTDDQRFQIDASPEKGQEYQAVRIIGKDSHLARSSKRQGFGWKRWSRRWLYDTHGLFDAYRVSYR
jgi:hypothetical protein